MKFNLPDLELTKLYIKVTIGISNVAHVLKKVL